MGHADVRSPIGPPPVHAHHDHHMQDQSAHAHMVDDFRRRFWVSLALTVPVLATSEMIQHFLGLRGTFAFPGDRYVEFGFASAVYFYGGWPFLTGLVDELRKRLPGMMTLVALAITVAYVYSALVVFGLPGSVFFWETATLIDIMLLATGSRCARYSAPREPSSSWSGSCRPRRIASEPTAPLKTLPLLPCSRTTGCSSSGERRSPLTGSSSRAAPASTRRCSPASRSRWRRARVTRSSAAP